MFISSPQLIYRCKQKGKNMENILISPQLITYRCKQKDITRKIQLAFRLYGNFALNQRVATVACSQWSQATVATLACSQCSQAMMGATPDSSRSERLKPPVFSPTTGFPLSSIVRDDEKPKRYKRHYEYSAPGGCKVHARSIIRTIIPP